MADPGCRTHWPRCSAWSTPGRCAGQRLAATYKLVTFVPPADADRLVDALAAAGAGRIGGYDRCAWTTEGTGTFRGGPGARPAVGEPGRVEQVAEVRVEMVLPGAAVAAVTAALRAAHPYEEPAYDLVALAPAEVARGTGAGRLPHPVPLRDFAAQVGGWPATVDGAGRRRPGPAGGDGRGLRGAGRRPVRRGAGERRRRLVTADLRHHPAAEALEHGRSALVDCAHWATEWPWLAAAERCARDWPSATRPRRIAWTPGSRRSSPTRGRPSEPTRGDPPGRPGARPESTRADQQRLLDVQDLDTRLAQLAHRRATLPEHAKLADLQRQDALRDQLVVVQTEESDLERELKKAEGDVDQVRPAARPRPEAARRRAGVLAQGARGLQHEIATLARRQGDLEEIVLDVMERLESAPRRRADRPAGGCDRGGHRPDRRPRRRDGRDRRRGRGAHRAAGDPGLGIDDGPRHAAREDPRPAGRRGGGRAEAAALRGLPAGAQQRRDRPAARCPRGRGAALRGVPPDPGAHRRVGPDARRGSRR